MGKIKERTGTMERITAPDGREFLIIYADDDNNNTQSKITWYDRNSTLIAFEDKEQNIITIPITRLMKIKEREEKAQTSHYR